MYEVIGYQKVNTKSGKIGYFLWLGEPIDTNRNGAGMKAFQLFVFADQLPQDGGGNVVSPTPGTAIEVRFSRNVNPRTNQPYVESINY